jgi:hypothetical protein
VEKKIAFGSSSAKLVFWNTTDHPACVAATWTRTMPTAETNAAVLMYLQRTISPVPGVAPLLVV